MSLKRFKRSLTSSEKSFLDLHYIDHSSPLLSPERTDLFHSLVMKLMWFSQRCRLDIATAIAFLCTHVSNSTEQDWSKLKRALEFLNGTVHGTLTLGADSLERLLNFVNVSFAVHTDMRSIIWSRCVHTHVQEAED